MYDFQVTWSSLRAANISSSTTLYVSQPEDGESKMSTTGSINFHEGRACGLCSYFTLSKRNEA